MSLLYTQIQGKGEPLVLLHGWAMHSGLWRYFAKSLARHYQVICVDLPSHGNSPAIEHFDLDAISQALAEVVPEQASYLGWSLGANVLLNFTEKYPEKVKRLILMAANPHFTATNHWQGMSVQLLQQFINNLSEDNRIILGRFLGLQVQGLTNAKSLLKTLKQRLAEYPTPDLETLKDGLNILQTADCRPALRNVTQPITAIFGEQDSLVPVEIAHAMQNLQPKMTLKIIPQAGHTPFLSHQQIVLEHIIEFMETS